MSQAPHSACNFAKAAITKGHKIKSIFFLYNGALNASAAVNTLSPSADLLDQWQKIKAISGTELLVCVSSAKKTGVSIDKNDGLLSADNGGLSRDFEIAGLGALTESVVFSDRVITFGSSP